MSDPDHPSFDSVLGPACHICGDPVVLAVAGDLAGSFTAPIGHAVSREDATLTFKFLYCPHRKTVT